MGQAVPLFQIVISKAYGLRQKSKKIEAALANAYYICSSGRPVGRYKVILSEILSERSYVNYHYPF